MERSRTYTYVEHHFKCGYCGLYTVGMPQEEYGFGHGFQSKRIALKALNKHLKVCEVKIAAKEARDAAQA